MNPNFPNFSLDELACADGTPVPMELVPNAVRLLVNAQVIRNFFGTPLIINPKGGYRHPEFNKKIGGAKNSMHMQAMAMDFHVPGVPAGQVHMVVNGLIRIGAIIDGGLGRYKNFTHYDIGRSRRWNG